MARYLSRRQDEFGFHYGFAPNDPRQINVRSETPQRWVAYVGGIRLRGYYRDVETAERGALDWMAKHPARITARSIKC